MKFKKYLLLTIFAAALTLAIPISGQDYYGEGSEKYKKLVEIFNEIEYAFSGGQYKDVINLSEKLKDIGFSYNDLEADEEAENSEERAIWIDIMWFRGISENSLGNYKEGAENFKFILENAKNPTSHVYTYYAEALSKDGDYKGAISILEKGVKNLEDKISDRDMHDLLWNLGWYYYLNKQYKKAIVIGFECSEMNPYSTGPLFNASLAFLALEDEQNALRYFLKAFNSSFIYDDEFIEWILHSVIDDVNSYIKEHGENDNLKTMLFLAYKGLDDRASQKYNASLIKAPIGNYSGFVDEPSAPFVYVIGSTYSLKEDILVDRYLMELRNSYPSYIEKSKNDRDFDWYYDAHPDKKIDKRKHTDKSKHIDKPKHINKSKHIDKPKHIDKSKHTNKPKHIKKKRR